MITVWGPEGSAVKRQFGREDRIFLTLLAYLRMTSAAGGLTQPARPPTVPSGCC